MSPCQEAEGQPRAVCSPRLCSGMTAAREKRAQPCEAKALLAGRRAAAGRKGEEVLGGGPGNCNSLWMGWTGRGGERLQPSTFINLPSSPTGWSRGCSLSPHVRRDPAQLRRGGAAQPCQLRSAQTIAAWAAQVPQLLPMRTLLRGLSDPEPNPFSLMAVAAKINLTQSCPLALKALFGFISLLNQPRATGSSSPSASEGRTRPLGFLQ